MSSSHSCIGRVGALALFLGVGGALAALPATASADTGAPDPGQSQSARSQTRDTTSAESPAPGRRSAVRAKAVSAVSINPLSRATGGVGPATPVAESLGWAALAVSRRELPVSSTAVATAAVAAAAPAAVSADPAIGAALLAAAKEVVVSVAGGENLGVALQGAVASVGDAPLTEVLADPAVSGQTAGSVTTGLAADPTVRTAVGTLISDSVSAVEAILPGVGALAAPVADAAVSLLADPAAASGFGAVANSFVTTLVGQTGPTLTTVATELIAGLSGSDPAGALNAALSKVLTDAGLQSGLVSAAGAALEAGLSNTGLVNAVIEQVATNPAFLAAIADAIPGPFGATVVAALSDPALVDGFLAQDGVVAALSSTASAVLGDLFAGTPAPVALQSALGALQSDPVIQSALSNSIPFALGAFLTGAINSLPLPQFVRDAIAVGVDSLVNNPSVQNLVGVVSDTIVNGGSVIDLVPTLIGSVISSPALQMALGGAIGQGVGALFGNNPIGFIVGQVTGVAATIAVGMASGLAGLVNLFAPGFLTSLLGAINPAASVYLVNVVPPANTMVLTVG